MLHDKVDQLSPTDLVNALLDRVSGTGAGMPVEIQITLIPVRVGDVQHVGTVILTRTAAAIVLLAAMAAGRDLRYFERLQRRETEQTSGGDSCSQTWSSPPRRQSAVGRRRARLRLSFVADPEVVSRLPPFMRTDSELRPNRARLVTPSDTGSHAPPRGGCPSECEGSARRARGERPGFRHKQRPLEPR
jgi:hypothetical protein